MSDTEAQHSTLSVLSLFSFLCLLPKPDPHYHNQQNQHHPHRNHGAIFYLMFRWRALSSLSCHRLLYGNLYFCEICMDSTPIPTTGPVRPFTGHASVHSCTSTMYLVYPTNDQPCRAPLIVVRRSWPLCGETTSRKATKAGCRSRIVSCRKPG